MTSYGSQPGATPPGPGQPPPQQGYTPGYVPPQGGPPPGVPPAEPPRRGRSPLLIIGIILLALLLLCGLGGFFLFNTVMNATQPVVNAGEAYLTALRDGDYTRAYDLSAPALQQEAGDVEGLQAALGERQLASWSFTSRSINNNQGNLSGTTTYTDGETGTVDMALMQVGNDWKVTGISLR